MAISTKSAESAQSGFSVRSVAGWVMDLLRRAVMLLPRSAAAAVLSLAGRREQALAHLRAVAPDGVEPDGVEPHGGVVASRWRTLSTSLLLLPFAVVALLSAFLATLDEIRLIFLYWLTDGGSIGPGTWGGPTMAGAWIVHAVLGIILLPVLLGLMHGLTRLATLFVRRLDPGTS
jgi:hypothetical protein